MNEYFVYCHYYSQYPHKALFIPMFDQKKHILENLSEIRKLCEDDKFIQERYKREENFLRITGYKIASKNYTIENIPNIINYFECTINEIKHDNEPKNSFIYYINDKNRFMSPDDLLQKLSNLTEYDGLKIKIVDCVMITDVPPYYSPYAIMRFYISARGQISEEILRKIMMGFKGIKYITLNSNKNYGYAYLSNIKYYEKFNKKSFEINEIKINFE